ncbi:MAG: hypothetical protein ABUS79_09955 [Pseudomonadota bacterium]
MPFTILPSRLASVLPALVVCLGATAHAEPSLSPKAVESEGERSHFAVMLGLGQWLLDGGNVAIQYNVGHLALEYSHGQGVHLSETSLLLNQSEKSAGADVRMPWTTGFGVGILAFNNLRVLLEFKANHYALQGGDRSSSLEYTTFTIGPGVFYDLHVWSGLFIQPSIRWWPTVATTMPSNAALARADGTVVKMASHDSGVFPNVSLGWQFF